MKTRFSTIFLLILLLVLTACGSDKPVANLSNTNMQFEFLPVEKAFVFTVEAASDNSIVAKWEIAEGYHLYKNKFEFSLGNEDYQINELNLPKGKMILDKTFGDQESYSGKMAVNIKLKSINETGKVTLNTKYQGCSEKGLCYPPQKVASVIELKSS